MKGPHSHFNLVGLVHNLDSLLCNNYTESPMTAGGEDRAEEKVVIQV